MSKVPPRPDTDLFVLDLCTNHEMVTSCFDATGELFQTEITRGWARRGLFGAICSGPRVSVGFPAKI